MPHHDRALLERDICRDPARALECEWLETDGVGGFASSTVSGCPTRRYHGLLVAHPPELERRHLFLARLDETVTPIAGERCALSTARWRDGVLAPRGDQRIETFELAPHPVTTFRAGAIEVRKEVLMPRGRAAVLCRYEVRGGAARIALRPLLACREVDALHFRNDALDPTVRRTPTGIGLRPYAALPELQLTVAAGSSGWSFAADPVWQLGLEYSADHARGYDSAEDQWSPGTIVADLADGEAIVVAAAVGEPVEAPRATFDAVARARREARAAVGHLDDPIRARLSARADDFLYVGPQGRLGICAGYPWFGEWGRDTFLSLPGLTLARGRLDQCEEVLTGALPFLHDGLLPNIYGSTVATSHYGSVDAALWFARAVDLWGGAGGDTARFAPALLAIARAYHDGTGLGIRAREDGLLVAGSPELNATWMDARTHEGPVTPRDGMPVEIEALWLSLLDQVAELEGGAWRARRDRAHARFVELFWLPGDRYLADRIAPDGRPDPRVRPNMVLAAALPRSPLSSDHRAGVLARAERDLLTPRGLRTLAPHDPDYRPVYRGGPVERDHAYHQGTVWPWLLGGYVELALRVRGRPDVQRLRRLLDGFAPELDRAGLDHVSEVFDGDPPHHPGGTIAQAWSTAEILRAHWLLDRTKLDEAP